MHVSPRPDHLLVEMPLMLHLGAVLKPNETSSLKRIETAAVADVVHRRNDVDRQSDQNVPGNVLERIDQHCVETCRVARDHYHCDRCGAHAGRRCFQQRTVWMNVEGVLARPRREQARSFPVCRKASDQNQSGG